MAVTGILGIQGWSSWESTNYSTIRFSSPPIFCTSSWWNFLWKWVEMIYIPRKINGWNLRIYPWKRKKSSSKPSFSGSMLIFWGVNQLVQIFRPKIVEDVDIWVVDWCFLPTCVIQTNWVGTSDRKAWLYNIYIYDPYIYIFYLFILV